jgi:hypothetical protein
MQAHIADAPRTPSEAAAEPQGIDRLTLGVVVGVLLLVAIGIGVAALANRAQPAPDLSTPDGVTLAYELDIQRGEADAAWNLLTTEAQAGTTRQEFLARAAGLRSGQDTQLSVENVRVDGNTAHLDVVRVVSTPGFLGFGAGRYTSRSPVTLQRENDVWRISVPADAYVVMRPAGTRP